MSKSLLTADSTNPIPIKKPRRRRWFSFGTRGLLLAVLIVACGLGWFANRWRTLKYECHVVAQVREWGGQVEWDDMNYAPASVKYRDSLWSDVFCLRYRGRINGLWLHQVELNDEQLDAIVALPKVASLMLNGTPISDDSLRKIGKCRELVLLDLDGTGIGDAGLRHLANLDRLSVLRLNNTAVTDAGLAALDLPASLQFLEMRGTYVTQLGVDQLRQSRPGLEITWSTAPSHDLRELAAKLVRQGADVAFEPPPLPSLDYCVDEATQACAYRISVWRQGINPQTLPLIRAMASQTPITLQLTDLDSLPLFGELAGLTELWLGGSFGRPNLQPRHLANCGRLESLDLHRSMTDDQVLAQIPPLPTLKSLNLADALISDNGLSLLAAIGPIEVLDLSSTDVTDHGVKSLGALKHLRELDLGATRITAAAVQDVAEIKTLESLAINSSYNEGKPNLDAASFLALGRLPKLRQLVICCAGVDDADLKAVALPNLELLQMDHNPVGDSSIETLLAMPKLKCLVLGGTKFSRDGVERLVRGLPGLKKLDLSSLPVSDASVDALSSLTKLKHLCVRDTEFTAAGIERLQRALPHCQIEH